jgi:hypothetical protein
MAVTTDTQPIDDQTCLSLWVTWLSNLDVKGIAFPADLAVRGSKILKAQWAAREIKPTNTTQAGIWFASVTWTSMLEEDKVTWLGRLIDVCTGGDNPEPASIREIP